MKTIYIIRHAKSSWKNPDTKDLDRPLNSRGERDAPEMGRRLALQRITADLFVSSPANRAYTTATIIAKQIKFPVAEIVKDRTLYHADQKELLRVIQKQENRFASLMVFGHNPGLTDFANYLAGEAIENIPTSGIVGIRFKVTTWELIGKETGELLFFDFPKKPFENKFLS